MITLDWISGNTLFLQMTINKWSKLSTNCVTATSVNMFKYKVDTSQDGGLHINENVGLSISRRLTCPLAIWVFVLDGNLVKIR